MTISKDLSTVVFDKLVHLAEQPDPPAAQKESRALLDNFFCDKSEDFVLTEAHNMIQKVGQSPSVPAAPPTPKMVLVQQLGGLCLGAEVVTQQRTLARSIAVGLLPAVCSHSERARLSQTLLADSDLPALAASLVGPVMGALTNLVKDPEAIDTSDVEPRIQEACSNALLHEDAVLSYARYLSADSIRGAIDHFGGQAGGIRGASQAPQRWVQNLVEHLPEILENVEHKVPAPALTAQEQAVLGLLKDTYAAQGNEAMLAGILPSDDDTADARLIKQHATAMLIRGIEPSHVETLQSNLAFYKTPAGREYCAAAKKITAAGTSELLKAQMGWAVEPLAERIIAQKKREDAQREDFLASMMQGVFSAVTQNLDMNDPAVRDAFMESFTSTMAAMNLDSAGDSGGDSDGDGK